MKNIFKQIKHFFFDNKEFFIRCTIMVLLTGLILGITCFLSIPASAADEPIEGNQVVIPADTYQWRVNPTQPSGFTIPLSGTLPQISIAGYTVTPIINSLSATYDPSLDGGSTVITYNVSALGETFNIICYTDRLGWNAAQTIFPNDNIPSGYGQRFTISQSISVNASFNDWFSLNALPAFVDPSEYLISAGFYKANIRWDSSDFPATNDSIKLRYYSTYNRTYVDKVGMIFAIESDIVSIWYGDVNVYADGWGFDAYQYIEITEDVFVDSEFYTVFNSIFTPSTQSANALDTGFVVGYEDGYSDGLDVGYTQGYNDGIVNSSGNVFTDIIGGVVGALDAFTLFGGYSLLDLITTLLGGFALIWILKLLAGG